MASRSEKISSHRQSIEENIPKKKRKSKDTVISKTTCKRPRTSARSKSNIKMTETLCNTVGSISSFSKIEKGISSTDRILKDRTLATNVQNMVHKTDKHTGSSSYTFSNFFVPVVRKLTPLPELNWADSTELWNFMLEKDKKYARDPLYLRMHKHLRPRMRSILLDWLIEVCEVYRLHRETFFLAVDFFDRYLSTKQDIPKQRLQLIGTTALFIASKMEEIYPPKLSEFAYVTDGACTESEILQQELIMLKHLNWNLCPVTCNTWLNIYLQLYWLASTKSDPKTIPCKYNFVYPEYSQQDFLRVAQLLDLCCLDIGSLQFSYSIIASSALYHMIPVNIEEITGHKWEELFPCIQWMQSFAASVISDMPTPVLKTFEHVKSEDAHNIQTHISNLTLLENAQNKQCTADSTSSRSESPPIIVQHFAPLTPPSSTKKALPT